MLALVLGLLVFLGVHSTRIVAVGWRSRTIARMGPMPWKAVYSLVSIAAFVLIVWGYGQARQQVPLWVPPAFMRHVTALLMLPVFILFVAAYVPRNGIKARLGHPQILSVKLWAFAHLLSNGNLADVLLFGSFLVWAIFDFRAAKARDRDVARAQDDPWNAPTGLSPLRTPMPAPEASRTRGTIICVVLGLAVYAAFVFGLHAMLIGVKPV